MPLEEQAPPAASLCEWHGRAPCELGWPVAGSRAHLLIVSAGNTHSKQSPGDAGETAQQLRALAALAEDLGSVHGTHMVPHNHW